jgi:serine/threonine protein kinase
MKAIQYSEFFISDYLAHENMNTSHKDIKFENLYLDEKGRLRVSDYGMAKLQE